ncbi:Hypothetical predicted protein [Olea europaea subsp. europaea]|uniref:Uncharacterized protein n=1 Tax=Olea europaea subsp. europaea TaxID=158383 RepID=A0A8S0V4X4_OLEEU|nr:Hypothetical predicted protein [Olea europaea subsp. europaea]
MVAHMTWLRYIASKIDYSISLTWKTYRRGQIADTGLLDSVWKTLFQGKMTKILAADPTRVGVGDVVVLKDPMSIEKYLVRRLAAIEGYEMASIDEKDEPFVLERDQCWLLADNENLKTKQEAYDSRTFGPVSMIEIIGRVICCLRTVVDHGPVNNSHFSARKDLPVLEVELDVDEMAKIHKA